MYYARRGTQGEDFQVLYADLEDIQKRYYIDGTIHIPKDAFREDPYNLGNYTIEPEECDFQGFDHDFSDSFLVLSWELPQQFSEILEWYDCPVDEIPEEDLQEMSEDWGETITHATIKAALDSIPDLHDPTAIAEEKVVVKFDGSNIQTFVVESELDRDDIFEDVSDLEEFKNLRKIDREEYSTGHYELLKNDQATWLVIHSRYQGQNLTDDWYSVPQSTKKIKDALEYMEGKWQ